MLIKIPSKPQAWLRLAAAPARLARVAGASLLMLAGLSAQAQTATTVFSEDFEGATSGFTLENGSQTNQWAVAGTGGNGPTSPGTKAAYISTDFGVSNTYSTTAASTVHLYRDVTLPAGQAAIQLNFDWRAAGEGTSDYLLVQVAPPTFAPVAGTVPAAASVTVLAQLNLQATFTRTTLVLPASLAGTTQRLIFTWTNNAFGGTQPPALIDNVTLTTRATAPLSAGAYTINNAQPTAGTNFASFTDAASRLNLDGIGGPVTFAVSGGPYTEQFLLGQVPGSSATNTIVVNGGGRTIRFASANSNQRAVVQLNGTDYTTINNLDIDATGGTGASATYGYGVLLTNAADNDQITNNTITADGTSTSSNFAGIAVNGSVANASATGNSANNLLVQGNTVTGGYYGISLYGTSATAQNTGNIVRNNVIRDFYSYGIYVGFQAGAQLVGNEISRPLRTIVTSFYGIGVLGTSNGLTIEKNRLHDPFAGNTASVAQLYGIYLAGNGSTSTVTNDIVNNVLYNLVGGGTQYLIYSGAPYGRIYNNTLTSDDQSANSTYVTYALYVSGGNGDLKNNVVRVTRSGTGLKYGVYLASSSGVVATNYNDLFVPAGNVGYYSANFATLASWQAGAGSTFDQNSVAADPLFANASTGNLVPADVALNNSGTPLARVTDDITGAPRSAVPDMGAYEFAPVVLDILPFGLASPALTSTCYGTAEALIVQVRNSGSAALSFATNSATVTVVVTPPTGTAQILTTTLSTGTLASGATQAVTLPGTLNMAAAGTYTFAITATAVGDQNSGDDVLTPAVSRTVVAPAAGTLAASASDICVSGTTTFTLAGSANGAIQYQSSPSATGTFTDIAGATAATFTTPVLTSTTYYRTRTGCNASLVYSNIVGITVNNPLVASTNTPVGICAGSAATLTATTSAGSTARFYAAATGGTALPTTTVGSYTTPALAASTTYYAAAATGGAETVGATAYTSTAQTPNTGNAIYFTCTGSFTLSSVTVYLNAGQAAGTVTINLLAGRFGAVVNGQSTPFAVPAGPSTGTAAYVIPLNYFIPTAGQYTLYLPSASQSGLLRDIMGVSFPYTSPSGLVSLTAPSAAGYYPYFYNWQITNECVGAQRTPIQVAVAPAPTATLTAAPQPNGAVLLTAGTVAGATYQFFRNGVAVGTAATTNTLLLPSATLNGSYTVVVTSGGCTSVPSAAVAVTITGTRTATLNGVSLLVYPNPTPDGRLTLELTGPQAKAAQLEVLNSLGQSVQRRTLLPGTAQLSLAGLAAGVYTLRVQTEQGILTQRVVRE